MILKDGLERKPFVLNEENAYSVDLSIRDEKLIPSQNIMTSGFSPSGIISRICGLILVVLLVISAKRSQRFNKKEYQGA